MGPYDFRPPSPDQKYRELGNNTQERKQGGLVWGGSERLQLLSGSKGAANSQHH